MSRRPCAMSQPRICSARTIAAARFASNAVAGFVVRRGHQRGSAAMPVRLGISPIGWSNDDLPELGGGTPLEACLAEARLTGFEGIELGNKFPRDPAVLRPILERHGLCLISGWYSGRLLDRSATEELTAIEAHRALLVTMGCAVLVYAETSGGIANDRGRPLSSRPRLGDD